MEELDVYDEDRNYIGKYSRNYVHENALWHNTVHCWIFDRKGNVYFQIRNDENKLYTTASGHVLAGETIKEAFTREVKEEIGIDIEEGNIFFIDTHKYIADKIKKDGSVFKDRAFVNLYSYLYSGNDNNFMFDTNEVKGLAKMEIKDALKLFNKEKEKISAQIITPKGKNNKNIKYEDFLVVGKETPMDKYGSTLNKISEIIAK